MDGTGHRQWIIGLAIAVEGGLILAAELIGRLLGMPPTAAFRWTWEGLTQGLLATVPLAVLFLILVCWPIGPFRAIHRFSVEVVCPALAPCTVVDLLGISALAGLGEEMFFRGVVQGALQETVGIGLAVALASLLFGVLHAVTVTYAVLATVMGAYLGVVWLWTDNLLAPALAHGLYDFLVLLYLLRGPGSAARRFPPAPADDEGLRSAAPEESDSPHPWP